MGALMQPRTVPEAQGLRRMRRRGVATDLLRSVDPQEPQRRLVEAYEAHAATGILPARRSYALKRLLDVALAAPALMVTLPLYPLITLAIRLDSPGPGLYRQIRVGKDGRLFVAYKFRTMRHAPPEQAQIAHLELVTKWMTGTPLVMDAASLGASPGIRTGATAAASAEADVSEQLAVASSLALARVDGASAVSAGTVTMRARWRRNNPAVVAPRFKHTHDPRITRLGHILRKLSIDELPQLINVVRGEMSLVGPRPPVAYEVDRYSERALARLRVLPGITGQWQVEGRGHVSFNEMVEMDLYYAAHSSLRHDVALILRTVPAVLRCSGAG